MDGNCSIVLKRISDLKPIEGYIEELLPKVREYIIKDGYWIEAIKIEEHGLILDGHHRFEIAKRMKLKKIPVIIFNYNTLPMWSLRKNIKIKDCKEVIEKVLDGYLYPNKTVKHKFPNVNYKCKINLKELL